MDWCSVQGESDTHLLVANLPWISVLSRGSQTLICWWLTCDGYSVLSRGSQTLICWGLTCDGLVFCEGEVTDSHLLGANLRWISVL